ncbi:MAG: PP2C family protein-serine/threonine phosphatase, partial [Flavobacteriales bacterium]
TNSSNENSRQEFMPGEVLDKLRERIIGELSQNNNESFMRDGIDMTLIKINHSKDSGYLNIQFAGARNSLYVVRNEIVDEIEDLNIKYYQKDEEIKHERIKPFKNSNDGIEIKGDKQGVGFDEGSKEPFTTVSLQLKKGDMLYFLSDGFPDQFGRKTDKKFRYGPFKDLLLNIHDKPAGEQQKILDHKFEEWKGNTEQVDDVCVVGVRA